MSEAHPFRAAVRNLSNASLASGIGLFCLALIGGFISIVFSFAAQIWFFQMLTKRVARRIAGDDLPPVPLFSLSALYLFAGAMMVVMGYFLVLSTAGLMLGAIILGLGMAQAIGATWFAPRAVELVSGFVWVSGVSFARRLGLCLAVLAPVSILFAAASYGLFVASGVGQNDYIGLGVFLIIPSLFIVFYLTPVTAFAATIVHCRYDRESVTYDGTERREV